MQEKNTRRSNESRTAQTRSALIQAARSLFADQGYGATGTPLIVKTAEVTRGALYHHFADKADLFRAVLEAEAQAIATHINQKTIEASDPIDGLKLGAEAYFDAIAVPGRARLLLIEGPAILGDTIMAEIDRKAGAGELKEGLDQATKTGDLVEMPTKEMAELLSAAFDRAALAITDGRPAGPYHEAISCLLDGLKPRR